MSRSREIYIRSIDRRWKEEVAKNPGATLIFSPYVTPPTAERIVRMSVSGTKGETRIYTCFEAELFASGASSLKTLKALKRKGCMLFHLDNLHAKIILTNDFTSIGSQNLTARGVGRNLEATVALTNGADVALVRKEVLSWMERALRITDDMLDLMEAALPRIRKKLGVMAAEMRMEDETVRQEAARLQDDRARAEEERRTPAEKSKRLREAVERTRAGSAIRVRYEEIPIQDVPGGTTRTMRVRNPQHNMSSWSIGGKEINLPWGKLYLIILTTSGRLAWLRIKKIQTQNFAQRIEFKTPLEWAGYRYRIDVELAWDDDDLNDWNSRFSIRSFEQTWKGAPVVQIEVNFAIDNLSILKITEPKEDNYIDDLKRITASFKANDAKLHKLFLTRILSPHRYDYRYCWYRPYEYFILGAGGSTDFMLRLREHDGQQFLTATPY